MKITRRSARGTKLIPRGNGWYWVSAPRWPISQRYMRPFEVNGATVHGDPDMPQETRDAIAALADAARKDIGEHQHNWIDVTELKDERKHQVCSRCGLLRTVERTS